MNISIKCPHCGEALQVVSAVGLEQKKLTCPKCKQSSTIGECIPKLCLKVEGEKYQLHFGKQWVGRKKAGSDAEVQIPDEQRYMSRKHALIELRCTANGVECTFEEHGTNPTLKDGIELIEDDIIFLFINDCLKLGETRMYLAGEFE